MCDHNFIELMEGTTIHGNHLHVYQCECGLLDYGVENEINKKENMQP